MKTPFTSDQFFEVFKFYNDSVFPIQIFFYIIAFIAVYFAIYPNSKSSKIINGVLAFFWLWMGIVYHLIFFTEINIAAYIFGILFIIQGILFLTTGIFKSKLIYKFQGNVYGLVGLVLIVYSLIVYPILGYFIGHEYPFAPTFGLPCPTTIFTFGMLLLSNKKFPAIILIIPFIWSVIGFMAAINFGILEDTGLLIAGLLTVLMLLIRNRKLM